MSDEKPNTEEFAKWQPVMLYLRGGRLECLCGAIAVVVVATITDEYNNLEDVDHWCQACYIKAQREEMERHG